MNKRITLAAVAIFTIVSLGGAGAFASEKFQRLPG